MHMVNISEAKAQFSALIATVMTGKEILIGKAGRPVAKLVPYDRSEEPRQPGALRGKIGIADDLDELPDDIMATRDSRVKQYDISVINA